MKIISKIKSKIPKTLKTQVSQNADICQTYAETLYSIIEQNHDDKIKQAFRLEAKIQCAPNSLIWRIKKLIKPTWVNINYSNPVNARNAFLSDPNARKRMLENVSKYLEKKDLLPKNRLNVYREIMKSSKDYTETTEQDVIIKQYAKDLCTESLSCTCLKNNLKRYKNTKDKASKVYQTAWNTSAKIEKYKEIAKEHVAFNEIIEIQNTLVEKIAQTNKPEKFCALLIAIAHSDPLILNKKIAKKILEKLNFMVNNDLLQATIELLNNNAANSNIQAFLQFLDQIQHWNILKKSYTDSIDTHFVFQKKKISLKNRKISYHKSYTIQASSYLA